MKRNKLSLLCCLIGTLILLSLTACSSDGGSENDKPEETLIPISVKGAEIKVGETTVQTLLDQGIEITWMDENYEKIPIDPDWSGNEVMWLKYGLEYSYDLNFDMSIGRLTQFTVERKYDVDWNGTGQTN